jgi:ABC-2 type transport system permease protein
MISLILTLFDCFAWPLRRLGVDYPQFRAILQTKLMLDARRPRGAFGQQSSKKNRNTFALTLLSYAFVGVFISQLVAMVRSPLVSLTIIHTAIMAMISLALLGDYSTVLLDTTDNRVLLPRPVRRRTILFARLAHILVYLLVITLSLSVGTFIVGAAKLGPVFLPVFAGTLVLSVGLVVGTVSLAYLLGMRFIPQEKLRDVITYAQIVMIVVFVAGYQIVPRLLEPAMNANLSLAGRTWIYFCPPAWMAGPIDLALGHAGRAQVMLSIEAMLAPILLLLIVAALAPKFQPAALEGDERPARRGNSPAEHRQGRLSLLARVVARRPAERGAFELVWRLSSRDRQYKLRVYPTVAFTFVFAFMWMFMLTGTEQGLAANLAGMPHTDKHLFLLYFASMLAPASLIHLRFSNQPEAAWIYFALPLDRPGEILLGALKAIVVRLMLPTFALVAALTLAIWGWRVLPDILLALAVTLLICVLEALMVARRLPFSEATSNMENSGRSLRSLLLMPLVAAFGLAHYLIRPFPLIVLAAVPAVLLVALGCALLYRRTDWQAIRASAA